jgi:hypothetical protein
MMATPRKEMMTAVFRDRHAAIEAYEWLRARGYSDDNVSVLMSDQTRNSMKDTLRHETIPHRTKAAEGIAAGGAIGTALGAGLAALALVGTNVILPGLGLVVAGPVAAAFAGGGAGAVAGGLIGGLVGLGWSESNAKAYEAALREGGVILGVVPESPEEGAAIFQEFQRLRGENIVTV